MLKKINNDQWSSLFWLVCGIAICITSIHYGIGTLNEPQTGFVPFLAGLAIFLFALIGFVVSTLRQRAGIRWKSPVPKEGKGGRVMLAIGSLFAYAFLLSPMGFTLCTAIFVTLLLRMGKIHQWPVAIAGGIVTALTTYGVFGALLNVQFTKGPWGF